MGRIGLAFGTFFKIMFNGEVADSVRAALDDSAESRPPALTHDEPPPKPKPTRPPKAARSDAVTLLAALQRDARFIDLVQESLDGYSDAQIGAAARDVIRDCGQVLDRMFAVKPVVDLDEGADLEVPDDYDSGTFHLTGNVSSDPPFRGRLIHHGWQVTQCDLPTWTGSEHSVNVIAAAEVEV